jgi:hypothetical protein
MGHHMNAINKSVAGIAAVLALTLLVAHGALAAEEVPVGRLDVTMPSNDWQVLVVPDEGLKFGGSFSGVVASETKLFYRLGADGMVQAMVAVRASNSSMGRAAYMTYTGSCVSQPWFYTEGSEGVRATSRNCLFVLPAFPAEDAMQRVDANLLAQAKAANLKLPEHFYAFSTSQSISTGAFGYAIAFVARPLVEAGLLEKGVTLPEGVPAAHLLWGRSLYQALKSAVYSLTGNLVVPLLNMMPAEPAKPVDPPRAIG